MIDLLSFDRNKISQPKGRKIKTTKPSNGCVLHRINHSVYGNLAAPWQSLFFTGHFSFVLCFADYLRDWMLESVYVHNPVCTHIGHRPHFPHIDFCEVIASGSNIVKQLPEIWFWLFWNWPTLLLDRSDSCRFHVSAALNKQRSRYKWAKTKKKIQKTMSKAIKSGTLTLKSDTQQP